MDEVNIIMGQLQNLEYESDSSGIAGLGGHLCVIKVDEEVFNRKRKIESKGGHENKDD